MKERMKKHPLLTKVVIALLCGLTFYLLGFPCRIFLKISDTTEVRLVAALPMLFSMTFGLPGALGCAFANLFSDIQSGYSAAVFIPGFLIQIIYGYIPAKVWHYLRRNNINKFRLNRVHKVVEYLIISTADALLVAFLICLLLKCVGLPSNFILGENIFFNNLLAMIVMGIPYLSLSSVVFQYKYHRASPRNTILSFSLNEKFLLFILLLSILISICSGIAAYNVFHYRYNLSNLDLWNKVYYSAVITLNILIWGSLIHLRFIESTVIKPIEKMSEIAMIFSHDSTMEKKLEEISNKCEKYLKYTTEIGALPRSYVDMSRKIDDYLNHIMAMTAEKQKEHTALEIATAIQLAALPKPLHSKRFENYAMMDPALEVGGDFYDFFFIDEDHIALCIADVSGKGIPAALFMMVSKIILRHNLMNGYSPAEALVRTNQEICENNTVDMFVSILCGVLDLKTNVLTFCNAGHEKPALLKKGKEFYLAQIKSFFVVGGMPGIKYQNFELQMEPGDIMFTYTDGIPEAMNENNEEFGNDRMLAALNASKDKPLEQLCKDVREAVRTHAGKAPQFDDITMVAFRINEGT